MLCADVPVSTADARIEAAVFAQIELLIEVIKVLTKLLEVRVLAGEVPRAPNLREGEAIERDLAVDSSARILQTRKGEVLVSIESITVISHFKSELIGNVRS